MTATATTLRALFADPDPQLKDESSAKHRTLSQSIKQELKGVEWVASQSDLIAKVAELLDIELPPLLIQFWQTAEEIEAALNESAKTPDKKTELSLAEHTIEGTLHPAIEVWIGPDGSLGKYRLKFTVELHCELTGVRLIIKSGVILAIELGTCDVKGELKYGDLVLATAPREGAGHIQFGPAVALGAEISGNSDASRSCSRS